METKELIKILKDHPEAINCATTLVNILRDYYPNEKSNINAILTAYNAGILSMIRESQLDNIFIAKAKKILCEDYNLAPEKAEWVIITLCESFGVGVLGKTSTLEVQQPLLTCIDKNVMDSAGGKKVPYIDPKDFLLEKSKIDDGWVIVKYLGFEATNISIPSVINGKPVVEIGADAFKQFKSIKTIRMEESYDNGKCLGVKRIGARAFKECFSLQKVVLPNSLECIDREAFNKCVSLREIECPQSLKSIGEGAFSQCFAMRKVSLTSCKVEELPLTSFWGCNIQELSLPNHLKAIRHGAFGGFDNLPFAPQTIVIPSGTKTIENTSFLFWYVRKPIDIYIPASVTELHEHSFGIASIGLTGSERITIHCPPGSPAIELAHKMGFQLVRWDGTV